MDNWSRPESRGCWIGWLPEWIKVGDSLMTTMSSPTRLRHHEKWVSTCKRHSDI